MKNQIEDIENRVEQLSDLLGNGDFKNIRNMLDKLSEDEIAELLDKSSNAEDISKILISLEPEMGADVLMLLYPELRSNVVDYIPIEKIALFVENLPSDEAADLVAEFEDDRIAELLEKLPEDDRAEIEELISHPEESAGAIMAHEVERLPGNYTVAQAIADLVRFGDDIEEIFQIFITDENEKLLGAMPVQRLLISSPASRLSDIADKVDVVVTIDSDREYVADLFRRNDLVSAPVVDKDRKLIGRITIDDVLDVVDEEASEDLYKIVGIAGDEEEDTGVHNIKRRIPWLLISFSGELISGFILKNFSATLSQVILLTSFIPLIMALGGNVGTQSATVMIRRIALSRWGHFHHGKAIFREIIAGMLLGIFIGILLFALGLVWGDMYVGTIAAIAIFVAMSVSSMIGSIVPVVLSRFGADPAFGAGPFITTFNDVIGLAIYLGIATILL
ncbi:magnesium transporter [bacterium]|nr:magnesium transporter [bacterium]